MDKVSWKEDKKLQKILKRNAKRRDEDRARQGKDNYLMPFFAAGFLLCMLAMLVIGITMPFVIFFGGYIAGILVSFIV